MTLPEYITAGEVRKTCKEIGIRDWTKLKDPKANIREANIILNLVNTQKMPIDVLEFLAGLNVELEHGTRFSDANITNNHPLVTGKIVLAHLKESLQYYKLLEVAELQGDLFKAVSVGNAAKIETVYKKLAQAKIVLCTAESRKLGKERR